MCSPDVQFLFGEYVMTFNSWGNSPGKPNQLFYETSKDLVHWSKRKPLAPNLISVGNQHPIDASLAEADGGYYLVYKESSPGIHSRPRMAFSTSLEGPFHYVGDGIVALLMKDGKDNGFFHENFEFLHSGGQWFMLATDYLHNSQNHDNYDMQAPYLYALDPGSHWSAMDARIHVGYSRRGIQCGKHRQCRCALRLAQIRRLLLPDLRRPKRWPGLRKAGMEPHCSGPVKRPDPLVGSRPGLAHTPALALRNSSALRRRQIFELPWLSGSSNEL